MPVPLGHGRLEHFSLWLALLSGLVTLAVVTKAGDDRISAWMAALSYLVTLWSLLKLLRLHPLSPAVLYFQILALFHLGLAVPWSLGVTGGRLPQWFLTHSVTPALLHVILAFTAFHVGVTVAVLVRPPLPQGPPGGRKRYANEGMAQVGFGVMLLGVLMFAGGVYSLGVERLLRSSYMEIFQLMNHYDPRLFVTSMSIVPIGICLASAAVPWRTIPWVIAATGAWCAVIVLLGFRGYALVPILTMLAVLNKRSYRFRPMTYAGAGLVILLLIPAIRSVRGVSLGERSLIDAFGESGPLAAVKEMGGSLRPLVHTLHLMEHEPLRWGKTYWQAIERVIPNVSVAWEGGNYVPLEDLPPSQWVTKLAAPWNYANHGGLGFSAVAEAYMNFGTAGLPVVFVLLGLLLVWADRLDASRPTRLAVWAVCLGPLILTTRNAVASSVRPMVWGVIIVLLARVVAESIYQMRAKRNRAQWTRPVSSEKSTNIFRSFSRSNT